MSGAFGDLERPALVEAALRRSLVRPGSPWTSVEIRSRTGSTNLDLVEAAQAGTIVPGAVLVAEEQVAGRGRLTRAWQSPPRAGLTLSVLVAPGVPVAQWGWLPLLCGLAVVEGIRAATGLETTLKWPNDVLAADGRKVAGILAERVDADGVPCAVLGLGINVSTTTEELPVATATSLVLAGAPHADRQTVLTAVLRSLAQWLEAWETGTSVAEEYRVTCSTLGHEVRVEMPARDPILGTAAGVDAEGRLVVLAPDGSRTAVAAGDVIHLRRPRPS